MSLGTLTLTLLGQLAMASPAAPSLGREELVAIAVERFEHEDYDGAIAAFEHAHDLDHKAVDLFNIGRVYEQSGEPAQAREYYQRFLSRPELTSTEREQGEERLAALPAPVVQAPAKDPLQDKRRRPRGKRKHKRKVAPAVVAGATMLPLGVASLVTGAVLASTAARNANNGVQSADPQTPADQTPHFELAQREALAADILLGAGGALAAAGIVTLVAGKVRAKKRRRARDRSAKIDVRPAGAGLQIAVQF